MKISKKLLASVLGSALFVTGPISFINPTKALAAENEVVNISEFSIENSISTANTHSFSLVRSNDVIDVDIQYLEDSVIVNTITNGTEVSTFTYNKNDDFAMVNGEKMYLKFNEPNFVIDSENTLLPEISTLATPSDKPVFVSPGNIEFSKEVSSIGLMVTVIGGVIGLANLMGVSLPNKIVEKKVADWLSVVGLGTTFALSTMKGSFTYGLYRTTDKFYTGYPGSVNSYQYKFRYEDMAIKGSLLGYNMSIPFGVIGSWWFQSKPM